MQGTYRTGRAALHPRAQVAVMEWLLTEGFDAMAAKCAAETAPEAIKKYARIAHKNAPKEHQARIYEGFRLLGLLP